MSKIIKRGTPSRGGKSTNDSCALELVSIFCPAEVSDQDPHSLNVEIPDFRGEADLALLMSLPGVLAVGTFEAEIRLMDPCQARRDFLRSPAA